MNKKVLIIALLLLPPLILYFSRLFFEANYVFSSVYKLLFLFPIIYYYIKKENPFQDFSIQTFKASFPKMIVLGVVLASIYVGAFFLFKNILDLDSVIIQLQQLASINAQNIIIIGIYIIFINSLLEEYFWRGFIFKNLQESMQSWAAHLLTGIGFSLYHVMFFYNWFNFVFILIIIFGLVIYSIIMDLIFQKYKDLYSCWLVHGIADIAQIIIALMIFGLL